MSELREGLVCAHFPSPSFEEGDGDWVEYDDARFEVCADACIPTFPHKSINSSSPQACRYIRLAKEKSGGNFVGWKIEDGEAPVYAFED